MPINGKPANRSDPTRLQNRLLQVSFGQKMTGTDQRLTGSDLVGTRARFIGSSDAGCQVDTARDGIGIAKRA